MPILCLNYYSAFSNVDSGILSAYVEKCRELNKYISEDLGLGKSYEIGHAYFMEIKVYNNNISDSAKSNLFKKKLKPLIEECLRAEYSQLEIEKKLNDAKIKFLG